MNNICQITNFSNEVSRGDSFYTTILIGNQRYITVLYKTLTIDILTGSPNTPINKLGYICEPRGIDYPIMIETGGQFRTFQIGKTGMFEVTTETFSEGGEEVDLVPKITAIRVPIGEISGISVANPIKFKLDYVYSAN